MSVRFLSIEPLLEDLGILDLKNMNWVIVGGESGNHARPMEESWVISIQKQCQKAKVPFFFKQWGGVRKHLTGRELRGNYYDEIPKYRMNTVPINSIRQEKFQLAKAI